MSVLEKLYANMKTGEEFIDRMDSVLRDLRADFDVASAEHSKTKIKELEEYHVDVTGKVSELSNLSVGTNGTLRGLRGSGKSHLMLLSRDRINNKKKSICIYINLKEHLNISGRPVIEERFYVWALLNQFKKQLTYLIQDYSEDLTFAKRLLLFFSKESMTREEEVNNILLYIEQLLELGEKEVRSYMKSQTLTGAVEKTTSNKYGIQGNVKKGVPSLAANAENVQSDKESLVTSEQSTYETLLNMETFKSLITKIVEKLNLESIVFFYDEWSVLNNNEQLIMSRFIRSLSTSPIFHWIAYIPYKSTIGILEHASDMPHSIDLDTQFIFEENNQVCKNYFKELINKRLRKVFGTGIFTVNSLIKPQLLEMLVTSCMGNTRDFGVMLHKSWTNYKNDYRNNHNRKAITKKNVIKAIKDLAYEKQDNLIKGGYSEMLWNEIVKFVGEKKHTHFAIELNEPNINHIKEEEINDLLYHRILHLRKKDVPSKDGQPWRLAIYAVDVSVLFSRIYETKSEQKKIKLVLNVDTIHNQIRRYVFNLHSVMSQFRIQQGKQIICSNPKCKKAITEEMTLAWRLGVCTFCETPLPSNPNINPVASGI